MTVVRVGATKKFSDNWDNIFAGGGSKSKKAKAAKPAKASAKKKTAKKKASAKTAKKASRRK